MPVQSFLVTAAVLILLVGAGVWTIAYVRSRWSADGGDDRGDWEKTLVAYKNLRDEGVLSEEEFRKIRTLVEPRLHTGPAGPHASQRSDAERAGTDLGRK